jgi:tetratricopeptide (TPR) repeat protein
MDREDAIDHAERARALAATGGHRMVELDALCRLGELRLGAAGVQAYLEALVIADRLGEPKNVAHLCLNLADCYVEVEFPAQALPYYERALDLFEEERRALHEDRQGILGANAALRALRNLYHVMVKTTAAKVENHIVIALVEGKRGIALAKLGRYAEAVTLLKKAERTLDKSLAKPDLFRDPRTSLGFGYALVEAEAALRAERKGGSDP